jgi:hypothetical protein
MFRKIITKPLAHYLLISFILLIVFILFLSGWDRYTAIAISFIVLMIALSIMPQLKKIRKTHSDTFNFLSSLITSLVGVYLGVSIANSHQQYIENKKQIRILNILKDEISQSVANVKISYMDLKSYMKLKDTLDPLNSKTIMKISHYRCPSLIDFYFQQESFLSNIDPALISHFISFHEEMKKNSSLAQEMLGKKTLENLLFNANIYIKYSNAFCSLINTQIDIISNNLNNHEIYMRIMSTYDSMAFKQKNSAHMEVIKSIDSTGFLNDTTLLNE